MYVRQWVEKLRPFTDKWAGFFFVFCLFSLLVLNSMRQPLEDVCFVIFLPWCLSLKWGTEMKILVETGSLQQCKTVSLVIFLFLQCIWLINDDQQASLIVQLFIETIAVNLFFCDLNVNPINFYYFLKTVFSHPPFHHNQLLSYSFKYFPQYYYTLPPLEHV